VTLAVLSLRDNTEVARAAAALSSVTASAPTLHLQGLGTFGKGRVLYLRVRDDAGRQALRELADDTARLLVHAGLYVSDGPKTFTPHVTIAKARARERRRCCS